MMDVVRFQLGSFYVASVSQSHLDDINEHFNCSVKVGGSMYTSCKCRVFFSGPGKQAGWCNLYMVYPRRISQSARFLETSTCYVALGLPCACAFDAFKVEPGYDCRLLGQAAVSKAFSGFATTMHKRMLGERCNDRSYACLVKGSCNAVLL